MLDARASYILVGFHKLLCMSATQHCRRRREEEKESKENGWEIFGRDKF